MYKYGGVYSDIDTICINSVEPLYNDYDFVLSTDIDNSSLCNAFICSKKGNTFFKVLLHAVINNIMNNISGKGDLYITGSGILSETFWLILVFINQFKMVILIQDFSNIKF